MADLNAAAAASGLSKEQRKQIERLNKALDTHKTLLNLPAPVANDIYNNKLTPNEQQDLVNKFGQESPEEKPNRGWLGTAWHYTGGLALRGAQALSDLSTRVARTGIIALEENRNLSDAWDRAEKDGQKVFNEERLTAAEEKYGKNLVSVAKKIRSAKNAQEVAELMANATEEEKYWLQISDRSIKNLGNATEKKLQADRDLLDDAISAVNAAQYSPGRAFANLVDSFVPGDFYKNGFFYKMTSGAVDAAYRVFADPLLLAGKAKRLYDVNKYAYEVILGNTKKSKEAAAAYWANPKTTAFWDNYGANLKDLREATVRGDKVAAAKARKQVERLAPEFGRSVVNLFNKAEINNAKSAQAFFEDTGDAFKIMAAGTARRRILMPVLDTKRKARVAVLTGANKVFNIDDIGPNLVDDFFGAPETQDGIYEAITKDPKRLIEAAKGLEVKGVKRLRFSSNDISRRIDNAKRKFTRIPLFKDDVFDVTAPDAPDKIYQLAATIVPTRQARLISETFAGVEEVGKRKDMFYGLYATIAEIRGMNMTVSGQQIVRRMTGKGQVRYSVAGTDDYIDFGLLPSEMNNLVTAPSLVDIDRAASRTGLIQRLVGVSNSRYMESVTNAWSFLTLAGPRYAVRNSIEDLMVNIAIGRSPWGIAKNRYISTRLNTAMRLTPGLTAGEKFAAEPLGLVMRFLNKGESEKYATRIKDVDRVLSEKRTKIAEYTNIIKTSKDPKKVKGAQAGIRRLRKEISGGVEEEVRKIMAEALTAGRVQRFAKQLGLTKLDSEGLEFLTDQILYGNVDNLLATISEGGFNFAAGSNYLDAAFDQAKSLGVRQAELRLDLNGLKTQYGIAAGARGFREVGLTPNNEASMISWALRISFYGNDELGSIALANLSDDPEEIAKALKAMREWIVDPKNKKVLQDAILSSGKNLTPDEYAQIIYNRARAIVARRDNGKVNTELLDNIRSFDADLDRYVISGKLSLDDLPDDINAIPSSVVGPELVPVSDVNNYTSPLMQMGWVWLGLSTARISRQPLVLYEVTRIRKQMRKTGFEQAFYDNFTKGITDPDAKLAALENAKREFANLVEERAISQILPYVDNPLIRSQVSFSVRNFARFYRAQEDFYRRLARIVRYNPEAIQKLALTFDGIAHNGFVQEDDRGEKYFVYPHFAPGYRAMQGVMEALGIKQDFRVPFPVQFGGTVKMLSPSLNTESWLPTFSGPAAALPMTVIENLTSRIFDPGMGDTIARYTLGEYSVGQSLASRFMPAHVNRFLSAMDTDERNSQYASAYRKAVTYLEAAGHGIPKRYDEFGELIPPSASELETYREMVANTTKAILAARFVFGFFAPASPSIQLKSDMQEWIRDAGQANWKQSFNALREQYDGDYDAAMKRWVELYPNQVPYTVTESERKTIAFFGFAEESGKFVDENKRMFEEYPEAAAFLIPHKGAFSFDAYRTMANMGLRSNKRVEDYLREVQTASDLQTYYAKRDEYEESLKYAVSDFDRSFAREQFNSWKSRFFAGRPLVQEELNQGSEKQIKRLQALTDLQNFLADPKYAGIRPDTQKVLREMMKAYTDYKTQREIFELTGSGRNLLDLTKDTTIGTIRELAKYNENTQAAYDALFSRLLDD
jgi:hypothetical protein